jgi:2-phosphosulfolactate phosphatase
VQRTTAGTKGVVLCRDSGCLLAASFVCAAATARYIQDASIRDSGRNRGGNVRGGRIRENRVRKNGIRLVVTGRHAAGDGDEDRALADYLAELLCNRHPSAERYLQRVTDSSWGQRFLSPDYPDQPEADIPLCQALDRFPFAMPIEEEEGGLLVMRKHCF